MPDKVYTLEQVLTMLTQTPIRIAALTEGLTPPQLRTAPAPDEWPATDVLAHLRSCADVWGDCIRQLVTEDMPTIRAINPRRWIRQTNYRDLQFQESFHSFAEQRAALMTFLEALPPSAWSRSGTFTGAGRPIERTVFNFAHRLAIHERPHIKQIASIVSALRV